MYSGMMIFKVGRPKGVLPDGGRVDRGK